MDEVFFSWDGRRVLCGVTIDDGLRPAFVPDLGNLRAAMERAQGKGEVLLLYAHEPGAGLSVERLESVLGLAAELGLPFFTFEDLRGPPWVPGWPSPSTTPTSTSGTPSATCWQSMAPG